MYDAQRVCRLYLLFLLGRKERENGAEIEGKKAAEREAAASTTAEMSQVYLRQWTSYHQ